MSVRRLGYVGHRVRDMAAVKVIFEQVLGMQPRRQPGTDAVSYRMDGRHHRFTFIPDKTDALAHVGWEVDSLDALHKTVETVEQRGVAVARGSAELCAERAVYELYHFSGPDGTPLELFFGGTEDAAPFQPTGAVSGFRTGEQGLGHIVMGSADPEAAVRFYCDALGFKISDFIHWDIARVSFLHCNPRHHSIAVMNPVYGTTAGQMNHVMVQANSMDDIGRAYDTVRELGVPLVLTLGKHSNDHMTSFYMHTPGGWAVEYGYGAREIDAHWDVCYYDSPRLWGHHLNSPATPLV